MAQAKPKAKTAEKKATSRRNMPWSIKGVSPEAREAARKAVESGDMTMGEWLSEAIRAVAAEERGVASAPEPAAAQTEVTEDRLEPLAERIAAAERRTALMVAPLHELLETIARRLEGLENRLPSAPAPTSAPQPESPPAADMADTGNTEPTPPEGRP
ncbi:MULTISPECIES: hypothetical protein [Oceanibaculum]|uniref:Peptidoglycan-binding domain-containing protein n=2 Tax=Oceanibaculum indicum TaxID=526216 RepID=K2J629_9PROT|nr:MULTISPECIES: hypothetical protein [Oceanibaculum]EKE78526.1 peptidoglycan-binding domain-containing protein [Oceanibaculum indicum P24]MCH2393329.1 hypothetical protein [Oceanibaculum sp.]